MIRSVSLLFLFLSLLASSGCVGSQIREGQEIGDNRQTRSAMQLLLVRDCSSPALATENNETIRQYTRQELAAMKEYRDSGSELVVSNRPLHVDLAMAYARLATLEQAAENDAPASQWKKQALEQMQHSPEDSPLADWDALTAYVEAADAQQRNQFKEDGREAVPEHCFEE